jgi:hypothetical protein
LKWQRRCWFVITVVLVLGCTPSEKKTATPDLFLPKMIDGGATAPLNGQRRVRTTETSKDKGYLRRVDQTEPTRLDRDVVIAGMKEAVAKNGHSFVILAADQTNEECSSAGGSHAYFNVVEPEVSSVSATIHFGGHGSYLMLAFTKGQLWVAAVQIADRPYSTKNDVFCVPDRIVHGEAIGLVPVLSAAEAHDLVDALAQQQQKN